MITENDGLPADFDPAVYLALHADVATAGVSAADHYLHFGKREGRPYKPGEFDSEIYVSKEGLSTPVPSPELIFTVSGHWDREKFDKSRRKAVNRILQLLADAGIERSALESILDFGCGCGRILAGWEPHLTPNMSIKGCDINATLTGFCQANIGFAETITSGFYPPLPYRDDQFDFVYASSVYTHMNLPALLQWTGEFHRIIRPGGIAMISYHGSHYAQGLADLSKEGSLQLTERGYYVHVHKGAENTFFGSNYYSTFTTADFLRRLFIGFEIVRIYPGVSHGPFPLGSYQDILIARKI